MKPEDLINLPMDSEQGLALKEILDLLVKANIDEHSDIDRMNDAEYAVKCEAENALWHVAVAWRGKVCCPNSKFADGRHYWLGGKTNRWCDYCGKEERLSPDEPRLHWNSDINADMPEDWCPRCGAMPGMICENKSGIVMSDGHPERHERTAAKRKVKSK